MKNEIYVVYCYYTIFNHTLPKRKWVKFTSKKAAQEFVNKKVAPNKNRFLWAFVVNNREVDHL